LINLPIKKENIKKENATESWFNRLVYALLPLAFVGSSYLNIVAFVLDGHRHDLFRMVFTFGIEGLVALLLLAKAISIWRRRPECRRPIAYGCLILIAFGVIYLWALLAGPDKLPVLRNAVINGCYLVSACCAFLMIALEKRLRAFLHTCRIYAIAVSPVILYYCVRFYLPSAAYGAENLGALDYMSMSYMLLNFCVVLLLEVLRSGGVSWRKPGAEQGARFLWVNFSLFTLFAVGITLSGTKGAVLCLLFGMLVCTVYTILIKSSKRAVVSFFGAAVLSALLFSTVLFPDYGAESRLVSFLRESDSVEISMGDIQGTAGIIAEVEEPVNTQSPDGSQSPAGPQPPDSSQIPSSEKAELNITDVVDFVKSGKAEEALRAGQITEAQYDSIVEMSRKLNNTATGSRKYLWICAINEIKVAPLTGHGPMSYQQKYGTYPHNFFLELATDFGLPVMFLILILGVYIILKLIKLAIHRPEIAAFILYVMAYLPQKMISGSIYEYDVFFQYGMCILIIGLCNSRHKKENGCVKTTI